jgi:polar amino acid transport system substrate-binding protein
MDSRNSGAVRSCRRRDLWVAQKMLSVTLLLSMVLMTWGANLVAAAPPLQAGGQVHIVQAADTLSKLADRYYGNSTLWPAIMLATNAKAREDSSFATINNSSVLKVGQRLWIPDVAEVNKWMAEYAAQKQSGLAAAPKTLRLPDLGGRKVVAVTENAYTPLNFVDPKTGKAVGWEYDATNEICRRLNCVVDWKITAWDTMIAAVRAGQFDVGMDGITITDERKQQVDFSIPYMVSQQFMLVRADENRFKTAKEFGANPELLIGSQAGTTNFYVAVYQVLDGNESNPRIKLFENFGAAVQALIAGDVDMVLMDAASSRGYIGANPDKLKVIGDPLGTEEFGFIFTPGSPLVDAFNEAIRTMQADGFIEQLNTRWFFLYDPTAPAPEAVPTPQPTEAAAPAVASTEVIKFVPKEVPAGETKQGSCWTSSLAASREDAWRCTVGENEIHDPCFVVPNAPDTLVCDVNPITKEAGFGLKLTKPLPNPDVPAEVKASYEKNGWAVLLADGTACYFATGATTGIGDKRANYLCANSDWMILGDLQPGTVWKAEKVIIVIGDNGPELKQSQMVDVRTVWQ